MTELVDARDLKSLVGYPTCRFDSGPQHFILTEKFVNFCDSFDLKMVPNRYFVNFLFGYVVYIKTVKKMMEDRTPRL